MPPEFWMRVAIDLIAFILVFYGSVWWMVRKARKESMPSFTVTDLNPDRLEQIAGMLAHAADELDAGFLRYESGGLMVTSPHNDSDGLVFQGNLVLRSNRKIPSIMK